MIVIISGEAGSGKTTVAKAVAKKLGFEFVSTGNMQRQLAKKYNMSITELGILEEKDKSLDLKIDKELIDYVEKNKEKDIIIDSWVASHFIKHAIKIFLDADLDVRAERRIRQKRDTESLATMEQAKKDMKKREESNRKRWIKYYSFDYKDKKNYDYFIDTTSMAIEEVAEKIIKIISKEKSQN